MLCTCTETTLYHNNGTGLAITWNNHSMQPFSCIDDGEQKQLQKGHITDSVISDPDSTLKDEAMCELEDDIASLTVSDEMKDEGIPAHMVYSHNDTCMHCMCVQLQVSQSHLFMMLVWTKSQFNQCYFNLALV